MPRNVIEILDACKLFSGVNEAGFQRLAVIAQIRAFPKGRLVFREGDECPGVYVVDKGLVRVFRTGAGGKEHVLHLVGPGNTFAEAAAIGGLKCPANAETIAPTTCVLLPNGPFRKALEDDHALCLCMMAGLSCWVQNFVGLMEDVVLRDANGRVARFLLESRTGNEDTVELPGLKRHVASHLNLTSETLSRVFRRFVSSGLIGELENNRVRLLDVERLDRMAKGLPAES